MDTPTNVVAEKGKDPVPTSIPEETSFISDLERGEGEHEGIGIRESGHGFLYHLKLCMLCLLRSMQIKDESCTFHMTAEHKRLNPFDDIILMFTFAGVREYHLVQVKHGQLLDEKKIISKDFLKEKFNNWGSQFTLQKYFSGYCKLKKLPEFSSVSTYFIVCTNIDLDFEDLQKHCVSIKPCENPHFNEIIKESKGKLYRFASKGKSVIYRALAGKDSCDDDINNFIKDFILAVKLPNEQDLGTIIKKEMGAMFDSIDPALVAPQFQDRLLDWLKQRKGKWLNRQDVSAFTKEMVDEINSLPSKGLDISYKLKKIDTLISEEHLIKYRSKIEDFLQGDGHLLQIINKTSSYLSLLKINQILKDCKIIKEWETNSKNVVLYIKFKSFSSKESRSHLQSAFSNENNYKLMLIYCKKKDKLSRSFNYLHKAAKMCSKMKKKIILITEKEIDVEELEEEIPNLKVTQEKDNAFTFLQLTSESKESLLSKKLISFQGNVDKVSLSSLLVAEEIESQMESTDKLKEIIDCDVLVRLIKGKDLKVGNFVEETKVLSDIYLDRHLKNVESSNVIHEKDLLNVSNQVVIIIDEAGSGKSTLLNSLIKTLKDTKPNLWICRINLINYAEIFNRELEMRKERKHSYSSSEKDNTMNFFIDTLLDSNVQTKLESPFEKNLLRIAMQGYMKLFLIFDGFDEICPNYKDVVLDLLISLLETKFEKLYVTSRRNENTCPIEIPKASYLKTVPLSEEEQTKFLVDYWAKEASVEDAIRLKKLGEIATRCQWKVGITILENPLILFLAAEYLEDTVTSFCNEPDEDLELDVRHLVALRNRKRKLNFIELCKCFIEKKIRIYQIDKSKQSLGNISSDNKHSYFIKAVQNVHTYLALVAIFGKISATELNKEKPNIDEYIRIELPKIGLVYEQGTTFIFVHKTFTDFFVSEFIRSHPHRCGTVMETFLKDLPYSWWDVVFEYITDGWFDCSKINRDSINRIKYILTYIALVRRFRRQTTIELTGDERPQIDDDLKSNLLSLGLVKEGRHKARYWRGFTFVYWRMADYFVKNFIDVHRAEALTVSNYHHADRMERYFKWDE
ncbi:uncharacterized protein [Halyomorpha halys]|uniref:uncharacterized protein n=1 Tax=Halyomorpha halys TaxID=286706 RepID=UPI0006D4F405|nr:uncharacterized protein LOC106689850 [Halyomorpha halys]XP_014290534.1 uncharacterized protein LOC106689850 [Halyomorpha halys]